MTLNSWDLGYGYGSISWCWSLLKNPGGSKVTIDENTMNTLKPGACNDNILVPGNICFLSADILGYWDESILVEAKAIRFNSEGLNVGHRQMVFTSNQQLTNAHIAWVTDHAPVRVKANIKKLRGKLNEI